MKRIIIFSMCLCGLLTCDAQTSKDVRISNKAQQAIMDIKKNMSERLGGKTTSDNPELNRVKNDAENSEVAKSIAPHNPKLAHRFSQGINQGNDLPDTITARNNKEQVALDESGHYTPVKKQSGTKANQGSMSQQQSHKQSGGKNNSKNGSMSQQQGKGVKSSNVNAGKRSASNFRNSNPYDSTGIQ